MKITALDIKQKTFEKSFRGYEKAEVQAFLDSLAREWERIQAEQKGFKAEIEQLKRELGRLREVEEGLLRTFRTAEDTRTQVIEQSNRKAELQLREAEMKADSLLDKAKTQARRLVDEAEKKAQRALQHIQQRQYKLQQSCAALEHQREQLITNFRAIANDLAYKAGKLEKIRTSDAGRMPSSAPRATRSAPPPKVAPPKVAAPKAVAASVSAESRDGQSFFDDLDL